MVTISPSIKSRIFEIIITALLSAALAFFQSLITQQAGYNNPEINPEVAGGIGAILRSAFIFGKIKIC